MLRNFLGKPRNMSLIICAHPNEPRPKPISAEHSVGYGISSEMNIHLNQKTARENFLFCKYHLHSLKQGLAGDDLIL